MTKFYNKMWIATADDLKDVILREKIVQEMEPEKDAQKVRGLCADLYARYVILVNRMGDIYDQTLQVQKRRLLESLLEVATKRMLEMQKEINEIDMCEFLYIDNTLISMKLVPDDVQLLCPYYFPMKRDPNIADVIEKGRKGQLVDPDVQERISEVQNELEIRNRKIRPSITAASMIIDPEVENNRLALISAVNLIKTHELARQGRCLFNNIRMNPSKYTPSRPPEPLSNIYHFYHKPEQIPLIPIKRTVYSDDFTLTGRQLKGIQYYMNPERRIREQIRREQESNILIEEGFDDLFDCESCEEAEDEESDGFEYDVTDDESIESFTPRTISFLDPRIYERSARKIQNFWLRYQIRKLVERRKIRNRIVLGQLAPKKWDFREEERLTEARVRKRNRKAEFDAEFIRVCEDEKARILQYKSPWMMEDISDHIRAWFRDMYDASGQKDFDKYPPEIKGGTILVVRGQTHSPAEFAQYIQQKELDKAKTPAQRKADAEKKKAEKKAEKAKRKAEKEKLKKIKMDKKKLAEKEGKTWEFAEPEFKTKNFDLLDKTMTQYEIDWRFIDEWKNVNETPYMEWILDDKYMEVHLELRPLVDEFMRLEYEVLREALCKDQKKRYKPPKAKKAKKGKRKGKKQKKVVDPTGDRSIESLYLEMVKSGLIYHYPRISFNRLFGDFNFAAFDLWRNEQKESLPCFGELRNLLRTWTLGMGLLNNPKAKSICITGPPECGKKQLVYSLATEIDAVMLNLSPEIIVKYESDTKYLLHLISKMSKLLEPTIWFINGAHNPFIKKIPPAEENQPKILGKFLPKMVKQLKPIDKILLIGTTNEPWNAAPARMRKCYEKFLNYQRPDYGTSLSVWEAKVSDRNRNDPDMDLSALARVTKDYPTGKIIDTINETLNVERRYLLKKQPLTQAELLENMITSERLPNFPMESKILQKYEKFNATSGKLTKARTKYLKEVEKVKLAAEAKKK